MPNTNQPLQAFNRFNDQLKTAGINDQSRAFLIGRLVKLVFSAVTGEVAKLIGETKINELSQIQDTNKRQEELEKLFAAKKGQSLQEFREEIAENIVKDFENKAE